MKYKNCSLSVILVGNVFNDDLKVNKEVTYFIEMNYNELAPFYG